MTSDAGAFSAHTLAAAEASLTNLTTATLPLTPLNVAVYRLKWRWPPTIQAESCVAASCVAPSGMCRKYRMPRRHAAHHALHGMQCVMQAAPPSHVAPLSDGHDDSICHAQGV